MIIDALFHDKSHPGGDKCRDMCRAAAASTTNWIKILDQQGSVLRLTLDKAHAWHMAVVHVI